MSNREKINHLKDAERKEINEVCKRYEPALRELYHTFTIEEIESAGWKRGEFYPAMSNPSTKDWVYFYRKNGNTIIVHTNPVQVRTYEARNKTICDMDELNQIAGE